MEAFKSVTGGLLHCIDQTALKHLLRERGGLIFSIVRTIEDDTAVIPGVARSFVCSFVTAVHLDSMETTFVLENSRKGEVGNPWKKISCTNIKIW